MNKTIWPLGPEGFQGWDLDIPRFPAAVYCTGGAHVYGSTAGWVGSQVRNQSDTELNQQITYSYGDGFNRLTKTRGQNELHP
jgi:hypothetical protein